ncbi:Nucleoid occlusion protein [bioreactor metagenome]
MMEIIQKVVKQELTVKKTEKLINDTLEALKAESEPEKKQNIKCSVGIRIYLNTLKQAYDAIKNTGIEAKYNEIDKGDYMEVVVKIPKK